MPVRIVAYNEARLPADLMADDAANRCTADRADGASTSKNGASNCTDSGTDRGILVLLRHPGTTTQAEHYGHYKSTDCKSLFRFHWNTLN